MSPVLSTDQLEIHLREGVRLIHVLPGESFEREHIPGSLQACVYEMSFLETVRALVPDPATPIVVYGAGGGSLDSQTAAEKLRLAGYRQVSDFRGGLQEWKAGGRLVEGAGGSETPPMAEGVYAVDTAASLVRWTGRNLFNHHHGTLRLSAGTLVASGGRLESGHLTLDMNSIACEDLVDPDLNALLIRHLRDDDFFAVDRYPTAECFIDRCEPIAGATPGTPNFQVHGELRIRDARHPIDFPAVLAVADARHVAGQAQLEIDRTRFGSVYGSGRLFASLGRHLVNDHVHLFIKIHAVRA